jgi:antirestriction protein
MTNTPKIYIADLAAYNNGRLHGCWIDATQDLEDMQEQIQKMLEQSPEGFAEEYAIHDYEGFGRVSISEYEGIESVHEKAQFIAEHGDLGAAVLDHFSGDLEDAKKTLEDNYLGEYKSLEDYAQEITEQTTEIPESLAYYIDYKSMARDMELNGDVFTIETGFEEVHIFMNC